MWLYFLLEPVTLCICPALAEEVVGRFTLAHAHRDTSTTGMRVHLHFVHVHLWNYALFVWLKRVDTTHLNGICLHLESSNEHTPSIFMAYLLVMCLGVVAENISEKGTDKHQDSNRRGGFLESLVLAKRKGSTGQITAIAENSEQSTDVRTNE